jgi:hypothetical protein
VNLIKKIFKWFKDFFTSLLKILEHRIKELEYTDAKKQWNLKTGEKFNDIINHYPVSEETLLKICQEFAEFHAVTLLDSIEEFLWLNYESEIPRYPWMTDKNIIHKYNVYNNNVKL